MALNRQRCSPTTTAGAWDGQHACDGGQGAHLLPTPVYGLWVADHNRRGLFWSHIGLLLFAVAAIGAAFLPLCNAILV